MRLIIRADASETLGVGHVMRTSSIAAEFIRLGHEVIYTGEIQSLDLIVERFQDLGLLNPVMHPDSVLPNKFTDILLIDSYHLDPSDLFLEKSKWFKVVTISDFITPDYNSDLIIRPGIKEIDFGISATKTLSGSKYSLIRDTVRKTVPRSLGAQDEVRIVLGGGGSDPSNFCRAVTESLVELDAPFKLDVFSNNFDVELLKDRRINLHKVDRDLDSYANDADLALTLASTMSVEMLARELPMGVAAAFKNQWAGYRELIENEFAAPLGLLEEDGIWRLDNCVLAELVTNDSYRENFRNNIEGLFDLQGPKRIANLILAP
jgi:spore coat polysaccharide biosynthesis predicted glycosyltransferase SpsG